MPARGRMADSFADRSRGARLSANSFAGDMPVSAINPIKTLDGFNCSILGNPISFLLIVRYDEGPNKGQQVDIDYLTQSYRFGWQRNPEKVINPEPITEKPAESILNSTASTSTQPETEIEEQTPQPVTNPYFRAISCQVCRTAQPEVEVLFRNTGVKHVCNECASNALRRNKLVSFS